MMYSRHGALSPIVMASLSSLLEVGEEALHSRLFQSSALAAKKGLEATHDERHQSYRGMRFGWRLQAMAC